jgi:23S rRNA (uracil1939-C5)-methyltransferase
LELCVTAEHDEVEITALGAAGDGIAAGDDDAPRYVPFALPGERVRIVDSNRIELVSAPSPDRVAPKCRHFGLCGGCVAQHMAAPLYAQWKRGILVEAFRRRGLAPEIDPLVPVSLQSRRRAVLTAKRRGREIVLGYHRRRSHELFGLQECPVLVPAIVERLEALRAIVDVAGKSQTRITVLWTTAGCDVALEARGSLAPQAVAAMAGIAAQAGFARIVFNDEPVIEQGKPAIALDGASVVPPPGVFLQASSEAEAHLIAHVRSATADSHQAVDLFCGIGTFTFPLARSARVAAFDGDTNAIAALTEAARHAQGLKPISARVRDLFRDPLSARELDAFDAVVLDPPYNGARAQSDALACSKVATVVMVSCNPATLARDVRVLVDGGYAVERVTPIDQFLYSAELEVVAVLRRTRNRST